ncbi:protein ANTI-SILENCING 1-like [Rutidosis leptorrhynchoides]|uniref:protein ANTI-SILENCING 1-like n=1 Tax=Rutidosis leptorrhynchoides TaxID=125765 RepID=UPI003A99D687
METSQNIEFRWGRKEGVGCKSLERQNYGSFTYDGVEYSLYDSVYFWGEDQTSPHIGKLIDIYETSKFEKMVKVVWYFRPSEVQRWLKDTRVLNNELFLGSGVGRGLMNINVLETIVGKCKVVCTSKDKRNPTASLEDLKASEYVFSRTFDVKECKISETFPEKIAGINVGHFFNPKPEGNFKVTAAKDEDTVSGKSTNKFVPKVPLANFGRLTSSSSSASDSCHPKKRKLLEFEADNIKHIEADSQFVEHRKIPKVDSSQWFKKLPWEERMQKAYETGSLVLLDNLYPSFTSLEVEGIVMNAFKLKASAKIIQHTAFSNPKNGKALVIFNSKDEADFAISELNTKCLVIGIRPIVGSRPSLKEPGNNPSKYYGHIMLDKPKQRIHLRNAVSTCHFSQPNTVAFDMAMEWKALQKKWELCLDALHTQQAKEIATLQDQLKSKKKVCSANC